MITSLYIVIALERKYRDYHWHLNFELMRSIGSNDISYWLVLFGITQKLKQKQPPEVFYKKTVLENFAKFTGKHLSQSLFFDKVAEQALTVEVAVHRCSVYRSEILAVRKVARLGFQIPFKTTP